MPRSKHWKRTERKTAAAFGTRRTPLSGENSGHGGGDIILRNVQNTGETWDLLVECKHYKKFAVHTLFRAAQADAKKHGITPGHTILVTKLKGERGELVTLDASTFYNEILPLWKSQLVKPKETSNEASTIPTPTDTDSSSAGVYTKLAQRIKGIPHESAEKVVRQRRPYKPPAKKDSSG